MPSTWATLGFPAGQEFDWATSTHAYISFMRLLLAWSGGNIRQALAAYNAGQGNWQAGLGYADQISNRVVDAIGDLSGGVRLHDPENTKETK